MAGDTNKEKLIERYLYDVVRRLPEKQKKDIEEELRTLIEDMVAERQENGKSEEKNITAVLSELGEPAKLAAKYRGEDAHLIGGAYFPLYCQILKIVLICVGVSTAVSAVIGLFISTDTASMDGVIRTIQDGFIDFFMLPSALIQAFGWVTLIFFLMERNQVKLQSSNSPWTPDKLPSVPYKKAVIAKSDSIAGIVFGVLFAVWFICAPEYMGAWVMNGSEEMVAIPIFNMEIWSRLLPLFILSFTTGIIDDFVKLVVGRYNQAVMWVNIVCNTISVVVTVYLLKGVALWNPNFVTELSSATGKSFSSKFDVLAYWNTEAGNGMLLSDIFLAIILFAVVLDTGITIYRTLRYGIKNK